MSRTNDDFVKTGLLVGSVYVEEEEKQSVQASMGHTCGFEVLVISFYVAYADEGGWPVPAPLTLMTK